MKKETNCERRWWAWVGWLGYTLSLTVVLSGCGDGAANVGGKLTLDGQPLAANNRVRATIMFYPESGGAPAAALADESGHYQLATGAKVGLAPGNYAVVISATESEPAAPGSESAKKRVITPARYADPKQSGFQADVKPGSNTFDFELKSGAKG